MKTFFLLVAMQLYLAGLVFGQDSDASLGKYQVGFNLVLPRGLAPSTALTNSITSIETSYGFGILIQRNIAERVGIFFDFNAYDFNNFLASQGDDVQSIWTVEQAATHWDEPDAPQILYVSNLPTDVHFDMQATGFRLGAKYIFSFSKVHPWFGAGFGFYKWEANYYNEDKTKTYGTDSGYVTGLTYLMGIDFKIAQGFGLTLFGDFASPVAQYTMEGLFYPQWDITDYESHIMGQYRFGVTLSFITN